MNKPVYLYVTPFFPSPSSWRGAYCYDFVAELKKTGRYLVEVFMPGNGDDYVIKGVRVHLFKTRQLPSNVLPFLWSVWNQRSFISAVERCGIDVASIAVCHGHTANFAIYPLAIKQRCPTCLTLLHHHDLASFGLQMGRFRHVWFYKMIQFPILRRWHERIDVHVFISETCRRSFLLAPDTSWTDFADYKRQMMGLPYRPVRIHDSIVLYNGVDTDVFKPRQKIPDERFVIGCIGNFTPLKGHITLLKAVNILQRQGVGNISIVMIGSGPELPRCKWYAQKNLMRVEFREEVEHEKLADFYCSIDLFVLPSVFEGLGCVFLESIACGTPFLFCEGQPVEELLSEPSRWQFKKKDPLDLAIKIRKYMETRPVQSLNRDVSIDVLVESFLDYIRTKQRNLKWN